MIRPKHIKSKQLNKKWAKYMNRPFTEKAMQITSNL